VQSPSPSGGSSSIALLIVAGVCLTASFGLFLVPGVLPRFRLRMPQPVSATPSVPSSAVAPRLPVGTRKTGTVAGAQPNAATCEVRLFRGYLKSQFYATVSPEGERAGAVAQSPWFRRWGVDPSAPQPYVVAARDQLLDLLAADGWVLLAQGREWYSDRFVRRVSA